MVIRRTLAAGAVALLAVTPVRAQDEAPTTGFESETEAPAAEVERVSEASGAVLRGLDKLNGAIRDVELSRGETGEVGRLQVTLGDCRYPTENPSGDAYAYLVIREAGQDTPIFDGWMIASSPALNALEHARYDIWVIRCTS
ncbi:DUF2155 domain-containing protein [Mesobaculum littorinae]|uniref:DUF2155 domain-containing protein n=1 Tax=Mesobaculum littorinae TaxID=2486419 RepID=A0A438AKT0_9RHOB|nr:DUF2155 domain-containing protein [Mesobaculum littorinae]RVV99292.1 DUF2155 domain-containing protein [Mesobaculum littorinae]